MTLLEKRLTKPRSGRWELLVVIGFVTYFSLVFWPGEQGIGGVKNSVVERCADAFHFPLFFALTLFTYLTTALAYLEWKTISSPQKVGYWAWCKKVISDCLSLANHNRIVLFAFCLCIAIAGATELVQPTTGRSESWVDFINGFLGIAYATGAILLLRTQAFKRTWILFAALGLSLTLIVLIPAYQAYRFRLAQQVKLPVLGDFEDSVDTRTWVTYDLNKIKSTKGQISTDKATSGSHSLEVVASEAQWAGVAYRGEISDWSAYAVLSFDIFSSKETASISVRIDDDKSNSYNTRFNRDYPLSFGWNKISIPLNEVKNNPNGQKLNLSKVVRFLIFCGKSEMPFSFNLDTIRFEK